MTHTARILITLLAINAGPASPGGPVDPEPALTIHNASVEQTELLHRAVDRFTEVGLALPPLEVTFHSDRDECDEFNGTHRRRGEVAVINICNARPRTVLHELGHAWEAHAVTDKTREEFMDYRRSTAWSDLDAIRDERGIEQAASTIALVLNWQWGSTDDASFVTMLCSYEVLTDTPLPDSVPVNCEINQLAQPRDIS